MEIERQRSTEPPWAMLTYNLLIDYIQEQQALSRENSNDIQYQLNIDGAIARFTQLLTFRVDPNAFLIASEQSAIAPLTLTNPPTAEPFFTKDILKFMYSLNRIDTSHLLEDDRQCEICFECIGEWRWGDEMPADAGATEPFQVLEHTMPEDLVELPCGHRYGELCLRAWLEETSGETPTCPKCRAVLRRVGEVNTPSTE